MDRRIFFLSVSSPRHRLFKERKERKEQSLFVPVAVLSKFFLASSRTSSMFRTRALLILAIENYVWDCLARLVVVVYDYGITIAVALKQPRKTNK